jgi:hypothetical protein
MKQKAAQRTIRLPLRQASRCAPSRTKMQHIAALQPALRVAAAGGNDAGCGKASDFRRLVAAKLLKTTPHRLDTSIRASFSSKRAAHKKCARRLAISNRHISTVTKSLHAKWVGFFKRCPCGRRYWRAHSQHLDCNPQLHHPALQLTSTLLEAKHPAKVYIVFFSQVFLVGRDPYFGCCLRCKSSIFVRMKELIRVFG